MLLVREKRVTTFPQGFLEAFVEKLDVKLRRLDFVITGREEAVKFSKLIGRKALESLLQHFIYCTCSSWYIVNVK